MADPVYVLRKHFMWCPVHFLMESVASMDRQDREVMSDSIVVQPVKCDATLHGATDRACIGCPGRW